MLFNTFIRLCFFSILGLSILFTQKSFAGELIAIDHNKESAAEIIGDYITVINPVMSLALITFNKDIELK